MKIKDYPAGHSMDSKWFAVDKDGNVGFFDTSSAATMPVQFGIQESWTDFLKRYSAREADGLYKLILPEQQIIEIINQCTVDNVAKLIEVGANDKYLFFEGFFQLNEGVSWDDLAIGESLAKTEYDFALLLSDEARVYYISDVSELYDEFYAALKAGKIKACVEAFMEDSVEDYDSKMGNVILNGYQFEGQDWTESPYRRLTNPAQPLHIDQFAPEARKSIFRFDNISFKDFPYFQPIEFVPCQSYGFYNDHPETGYARVTLSDNETEAYVAVCLREWVDEIINHCSRCNDYCNRFERNMYKTRTQSDRPKIIILQQYEKTKNDKESIAEIIDLLGLEDHDWYLTNCVKCTKKGDTLSESLLSNRFTKCSRNLEKEVDIIQPLLIIATDNESVQYLNSQYPLSPGSSDHYHVVEINELSIPLVNTLLVKELGVEVWGDLKSDIKLWLSANRLSVERPRIKGI